MIAAALLSLLASAPALGIGIEETSRVRTATAAQIARALGEAIERQAGLGSSVDEPVWMTCTERPCAAEIRARARATEVVLLRIYGGVTKIRIVAERFSGEPLPASRGEADLPLISSRWREPLARLAASLFPSAIAFDATTAQLETARSTRSHAVPIALLAGGTALLAGGATFAILAAAQRADPPTALELERADASAAYDWIAAGVLFGASLITLGASLLTWLLE
jgi:hypothetical protein